jgi:hypothetical protein
MVALPILLLVLSASEGAADRIERALAAAADDRARDLCELAAVLDLPPVRFGAHETCVRAARRRLGGRADWRVRRDGDHLVVRLVEPSGHLDRIRAWYVGADGVRQRLHGSGTGPVRRFPVPRSWPEEGRIVVEGSSSLLSGTPSLSDHVARPASPAPVGPAADPRSAAPRPDADPTPAVQAGPGRPPWWLWVAGALAAGAAGLGVWQETR